MIFPLRFPVLYNGARPVIYSWRGGCPVIFSHNNTLRAYVIAKPDRSPIITIESTLLRLSLP